MATDIEEFESAVFLVRRAYKDLQKVNPHSPLLTYIELEGMGFKPNPDYEKAYVRPHLQDSGPRRESSGQLLLFDWIYPNLLKARLLGLVDYYRDLSAATKLDRLVDTYQD